MKKTAAYRFFNNSNITKAKIKKDLKTNCLKNIQSSKEQILVIQDTSEIKYHAHKDRIRKKSKNPKHVSNDNIGFFLHASIAVGADSNTLYGIPEIQTFNWNPKRPRKNDDDYNLRLKPLKERDSYRWFTTAWHACNAIAPTNPSVICDREADIYDLLSMKRKPNANLLIRSNHNRIVSSGESESKSKLIEKMKKSPVAGTYEFVLKSRGHSHPERKVKMEIRFEKITIYKPYHTYKPALKNESMPETFELYCVYAKKISNPTGGEEPIEWRLLTTHEVTTLEMARQCVEWYRKRWVIEEVFRVTKNQGFNIEDAHLESLDAMANLTYLTLVATIKVVSLKLAFDAQDEEVEALRHFKEDEIWVMKKVILPKLEGKTQKQKNPYRQNSLLWAAWIIARLGGWSGYMSQSKTGYITFKKGLAFFWKATAFK